MCAQAVKAICDRWPDKAAEDVRGKTEEDALVAYLQVLGTALKNVK